MLIEIFLKLDRELWQGHISVNGEWKQSFIGFLDLADLQQKIAAECATMGLR